MSPNTKSPIEAADDYTETVWRNHLRPLSGSESDFGEIHVVEDEDEVTIKVSVTEKKVKVESSTYKIAVSV